MADIGALFILLAVFHGGDSFSMITLATFPSAETCQAAADSYDKSVVNAGTKLADVACVPASAFQTLRPR